jgi:transketolase
MKQIIIVISVILFGLTADAQKIYSVDTGSICMPTEIAKQVASDLVRGDSAKAMLALSLDELDLTKQKLNYKDSLILTAKLKEINLIEQIRNEQGQKNGYVALLDDSKKQYADLAKKFKRYKVKKTFTDILFTGGLIILTGLLIAK